ncbi:hypothetical protein Lesp02_64660 [Lentzea sp. NBRC 105346]|uniref:hypothetical protein n=1 Tax=Lentzea sp. NBRC 105346 TaxID=3032205 RepID=UPI0024A3316A|nr:hypothetical protein [Lentzea sp. NBRC 105346]GLZ34279.1 hypothetical protein Lesp02_64660 [Lentzea sp. NBRC 105346]
MNGRRDSTDGPENVDEAFAEIVAGLEAEGVGKNWLDLDEAADEPLPEPEPATTEIVLDDEPDPADDDHYIPPEPPPFPVLRPGTIAALMLFVLGIVLLVAPGVFGLEPRIGTPLALVALCTGVGWLVLRMRNTPPPDDGAQV